MSTYRKGSQCVYLLHHHVVFIAKYRKPVLRGDVALRVRDLIRRICHDHDVEIIRGHVRPDHIHLLLSVPSTMAPSRLVQAIKGKMSFQLLRDFAGLRQPFWGRHLWSRSYFRRYDWQHHRRGHRQVPRISRCRAQKDDDFKVSE